MRIKRVRPKTIDRISIENDKNNGFLVKTEIGTFLDHDLLPITSIFHSLSIVVVF